MSGFRGLHPLVRHARCLEVVQGKPSSLADSACRIPRSRISDRFGWRSTARKSARGCDERMPISAMAEVVRFSDCVDELWANGSGNTRVIAADPADSTVGVFDWRLSIASVTSGAFSRFPGVDRVIVLADGPTMTLTIDGQPDELEPLRPKRFAGESEVTCQTSAAVFDFNVMTRRAVCGAEVSIHLKSGHISAPPDAHTLIVVLAGAAVVRSAEAATVRLGRFDSVRLVCAAEIAVDPEGTVAVVRIKYTDNQ